MNKKQKAEKRKVIDQYLDVGNSKFKDDEIEFLDNFVSNYDNNYKGQKRTFSNSFTDWSSDGKYTRTEVYTYTFTDKVGIHEKYTSHDDDGQEYEDEKDITTARGVLDWFKKHKF